MARAAKGRIMCILSGVWPCTRYIHVLIKILRIFPIYVLLKYLCPANKPKNVYVHEQTETHKSNSTWTGKINFTQDKLKNILYIVHYWDYKKCVVLSTMALLCCSLLLLFLHTYFVFVNKSQHTSSNLRAKYQKQEREELKNQNKFL